MKGVAQGGVEGLYCRQRHGKKENQMGRRAEKGRRKGVGGNKGEKGRGERGKKVRRGKRKKKGTGKTQKVWHQQVKSSQAQPHAALTKTSWNHSA